MTMIQKDTVKRNKHYRCLEYDADQDKDLYLIACGKEQCDPLVINGPDIRTGYHLHVILSGKGTLYAGGQEFHPHFGQMFLLKDREEVKYFPDENDPWEYCWVTFNGRYAEKVVRDIGFTEGIYCVDSSIEAKEFFGVIHRMHERPELNYYNDLARTGMMMEFLALALEATATHEKKAARRNDRPIETYINLALEFIHFNYMSITVNDIVEYVGFTRSYFTTVFKEQVGVSPQKYLLQYRMTKAREQLENTAYPIKDIAASVGYENALIFSRSFKQMYGCSPSAYRENLLKEV